VWTTNTSAGGQRAGRAIGLAKQVRWTVQTGFSPVDLELVNVIKNYYIGLLYKHSTMLRE